MYRWVDHTAEVELEIDSATEQEVFADALHALAELLGFGAALEDPEKREVTVGAADRPALLASWLEELVFLGESEGFVATALESLSTWEAGLSAVVRGRLGRPPPLVKAVTYHRLAFEHVEGRYLARVVLDV